MKLCILGNSHAGCLNLGWQRCKGDFPGVDLHFFASRQSTLSGLKVSGGRLVPNSEQLRASINYTSGGIDFVDLAAYDAFFLFGLGLSLRRIGAASSEGLRLAFHSDYFRSTLSFALAGRIRELCSAPIIIGHAPQHAARKGSLATSGFVSYPQTLTDLRYSNVDSGFVFSSQPYSTIADDWHTNRAFLDGAERLDLGDSTSSLPQPEGQVDHMNADFGEIYLRRLLLDYVLQDSSVNLNS